MSHERVEVGRYHVRGLAYAGHAVALRKGDECGAPGQNRENCAFFHRSSSLVKGVKKAAACFGGILRPDR